MAPMPDRPGRLYKLFTSLLRHSYRCDSIILSGERNLTFIGGGNMITVSNQQNRIVSAGKSSARDEVKSRSGFWATIGSFIGLAGGFILPVTGFVLLGISQLLGDTNPTIHRIGTMLVLATIPLIIFGGFCLDHLEKSKSKNNRE